MENIKTAKLMADSTANYVSYDDISRYGKDVCNEIINVLEQHCGLESSETYINPALNNAPIITKDGINIIKNLEFHNPIMAVFHNAIVHVGNTIEARSGDGTTTSMLIAARMMLNMFDSLGASYEETRATESKYATKRDMKKVMGQFYSDISQITVSMEEFVKRCSMSGTEEERIAEFVYRVAMCASHGDKLLSDTIRDICAKDGYEDFRNFSIIDRPYCTDKPIVTLEEDKAQYSIDATIVTDTTAYNKENGSRYEGDAHIFVTSVCSHTSVHCHVLSRMISETPEVFEGRDIIIMAYQFDDEFIQALDNTYHNRTDCKCRVLGLRPASRLVNVEYVEEERRRIIDTIMRAVPAIGGVTMKDYNAFVSENDEVINADLVLRNMPTATVTYEGRLVSFMNLFEATSVEHPLINSKEHMLYHVCADCKVGYNYYHDKAFKGSRATADFYRTFVGICERLNRKILAINGTPYERTEFHEVLEDVIGAIVASIDKGVVVGSICTMFAQMDEANYKDTLAGRAFYEAMKVVSELTGSGIVTPEFVKKHNRCTSFYYDSVKGIKPLDFFRDGGKDEEGVYDVFVSHKFVDALFRSLNDTVISSAHIRHIILPGYACKLKLSDKG